MAGDRLSPTARTLDALRCGDWVAEVVERWNPHTKTRKDFLGCIDIIAVHAVEGTLGVQATSGSNHRARGIKAMAEPRLRVWLEAGNRFQVVSWTKKGPRGKRKVWTPRVQEFNLQDLA